MTTDTRSLEDRLRAGLPSLTEEQARDLARIVARLIEMFDPERIYAFGSRARDTARPGSDVDLMVVVPRSNESGYDRSRRAYEAVDLVRLAIDILVWTREEFDERVDAPSSLPATILREGKILYAA
jgi:predicted nucleotidyltransferase